jgi:hypothetical protein
MADAPMGSPRADRNFVHSFWKLPNAAENTVGTINEELASVPVLEMALNLDKFVAQIDDLAAAAASQPQAVAMLEYVLLKIAMEIQDKANFLAV